MPDKRSMLAWTLVCTVLLAGCGARVSDGPETPVATPSAPTQPETPTPSGTSQGEQTKGPNLTKIHFIDPQHGWAGGEISIVTADGGKTWAPGTIPVAPEEPRPAALPDHSRTWCILNPGSFLTATDKAVLRSDDGGKSWTALFQPSILGQGEGGPGEVQCGSGAAWVLFIGGAGMSHQEYVVYRSTDDGRHWEPMLVSGWGTPPDLVKLGKPAIDAYPGPFDMVDGKTAFFLGTCSPCEGAGTSSITRTSDGGQTWQHDNIPLVRHPTALSFVNDKDGWILDQAENGTRILATTDGGKTWQVQYPPAAGK